MSVLMATDKVRMVVMVDDEVRAALRSEATDRGVDMGEIVNELVEASLPETLARIRSRRSASEKKKGGRT